VYLTPTSAPLLSQPTATTTAEEFRAIEAAYEQAYELVFGSGEPPSKVEVEEAEWCHAACDTHGAAARVVAS